MGSIQLPAKIDADKPADQCTESGGEAMLKNNEDTSMFGTIAELASDHIDIAAIITKSLQDTMNDLQEKYKLREEKYQSTTTQLKANYEAIMEEARKNAEAVVATAVAKGDAIIATAKEESSAWFIEKERLAHVQDFKPQIKLDVGGTRFTT
jgi:hypothetical protein